MQFPLGSALAATPPQPSSTTFDIDTRFAEFMQGIGGSAGDAGGKVGFTGSDPLLRSHFRIGACMAIPAMAAGVGAAAIWRERTGEGQDLTVDLRQAVWNTNPLIGLGRWPAIRLPGNGGCSGGHARRSPAGNPD